MSRRPQLTAADTLAIAISPGLIMLLIGSLVFFLTEIFYQGNYPARVNYVLALFVFATVLIGRISIEEGSERAALFALPLGLATFFVLNRFVQHMTGLGWLINLGILTVVWGLAHKLTWDCTVIDDREDASGEGLLQSAGLARASRSADEEQSEEQRKIAEKNSADDSLPSGSSANKSSSDHKNESGKDPLADGESTSWWERYQKHRSRKHAPGIWVLYLSLVALPTFGFLQRSIPLNDTATRAYTFKLLVVFVASALGLLLLTAFLSLRRYLRQKQLEMPARMTGTWVITGAALIVAVLIFSSLLPRPAAETPLAKMPFQITKNDDFQASRYAPIKQDGVENDDNRSADQTEGESGPPGDRVTKEKRESSSSESGGERSGGEQESKSGQPGRGAKKKSESQERPAESDSDTEASQPNRREPSEDSDSNSSSQNRSSSGENSADREAAEKKSSENQQEQSNDAGEADQKRGETETQQDGSDAESKESEERESERKKSEKKEPSSPFRSKPQPPSAPPFSLTPSPGSSWLGAIAKLVFYAILIAVAAYLLWKNRDKIRPALAKLLAELRELWSNLWGRKKLDPQVEEETKIATSRPRSFADYADPFTSGAAESRTPDQLVEYTLEAFQIWAREQGISGGPDQTARELAQRASTHAPELAAESTYLAELYGQVAYARGCITREQTLPLRGLWVMLRENARSERQTANSGIVE